MKKKNQIVKLNGLTYCAVIKNYQIGAIREFGYVRINRRIAAVAKRPDQTIWTVIQ